MSKVVLQVNYSFKNSRAEHTAMVAPLAQTIAEVNGLVWKIWLIDEASAAAGGIYLFDTRDAAENFAKSQMVAELAAHPMITGVSARLFDIDPALSAITHGALAVPQVT